MKGSLNECMFEAICLSIIELSSLLLKELIFNFELLLLQLVLCRWAALKSHPYIIHSADYIFILVLLRSVRVLILIKGLGSFSKQLCL